MATPVRSITFPFAGDTWAAAGSQTPPPDDVPRLVVTSVPVVWRIVPVDAGGAPIDDTTTTLDACLVALGEDANGATTLARTSFLSSCSGGDPQLTGWQLYDDKVAVGQVFVIGIPSATAGAAAGLRIFIDDGAGFAA